MHVIFVYTVYASKQGFLRFYHYSNLEYVSYRHPNTP